MVGSLWALAAEDCGRRREDEAWQGVFHDLSEWDADGVDGGARLTSFPRHVSIFRYICYATRADGYDDWSAALSLLNSWITA